MLMLLWMKSYFDFSRSCGNLDMATGKLRMKEDGGRRRLEEGCVEWSGGGDVRGGRCVTASGWWWARPEGGGGREAQFFCVFGWTTLGLLSPFEAQIVAVWLLQDFSGSRAATIPWNTSTSRWANKIKFLSLYTLLSALHTLYIAGSVLQTCSVYFVVTSTYVL